MGSHLLFIRLAVQVDVSTLLGAAGSFGSSVDACVADNIARASDFDVHDPVANDADFYLVRAVSDCGNGTYDGGTQAAPRDTGIAAAVNVCP
jgi:hypothetical protein